MAVKKVRLVNCVVLNVCILFHVILFCLYFVCHFVSSLLSYFDCVLCLSVNFAFILYLFFFFAGLLKW